MAALKAEIQKQEGLQGRTADDTRQRPRHHPSTLPRSHHVCDVDVGTSPSAENVTPNTSSPSQRTPAGDHDGLSNALWFPEHEHDSFGSFASAEVYPSPVSLKFARQTNTSSDNELFKDNGKRHPRKAFSITSVTRRLDDLKIAEPGYFTYIGKRCSATAETIASRLSFTRHSRRSSARSSALKGSSVGSGHNADAKDDHWSRLDQTTRSRRTADSEYARFYHDLEPEQFAPQSRPPSARAQQQDTSSMPLHEHPTAVIALMYAKAHSMLDEEAEAHLRNVLPARLDATRIYMKAADQRGVTALHLAVAYGFVRVCGLILEYDTDQVFHLARTNNDTSMYQFAKPAQKLACKDLKLYCRIAHCRQWVECGKPPPVSSPQDDRERSNEEKRGSQKRNRVPTNSTLATVSETPVADHRSSTRASSLSRQLPSEHTAHALTPTTMMASATSSRTLPVLVHGATPQYASRFTDSPTPSSLRHSFPNGIDFTDFAQANPSNRNSGLSNVETLADRSQQWVANQFAEDPAQHINSTYQPPINPHGNSLSSTSPLNTAQYAAPAVQLSFQDWVPDTVSVTDPAFSTTSALELEMTHAFTRSNSYLGQELYPDPAHSANTFAQSFQFSDHQAAPLQFNQQPHNQQGLAQAQRDFDFRSLTAESAANSWTDGRRSMLDLPLSDGQRPLWYSCVHGRPRNYV